MKRLFASLVKASIIKSPGLILFGLTICTAGLGQSELQIDSLIAVICKSVEANNNKSDSTRIILAYGEHLFPFVERFEESKRDQLSEKIYYRLQRNCREFSDILDRLNPPQGDWEKVLVKPKTTLDKKECRKFTDYVRYKYPDNNGDTVNLTIEKGFWIDHLKDGTYSKLKFKWINDCEFEIEFIESNNPVRNQFSKKGDRYWYQINGKQETHYDLSVQVVGTEGHYLFKLFH